MMKNGNIVVFLIVVLISLTGCATSTTTTSTTRNSIELTAEDMWGVWMGFEMSWINNEGKIVKEATVLDKGIWVEIREDGTLDFHAPNMEMTTEWRIVENGEYSGKDVQGKPFITEVIEDKGGARYSMFPSIFQDDRHVLIQELYQEESEIFISTMFIPTE